MTRSLPAALLASSLLAGCSWHDPGQASALQEPPAGVPTPALGASAADVLTLAHAREAGGMKVELRELWMSRVSDERFEPLDADEAARDPHGELAVIAVRRCGDWTGREHWEADRSSWFILRDGVLVAFDHWSFGPRCAVGNVFAPSRPPLLETEQTLRHFVEQRTPPGPPPLAIRFRRGLAYLAANRVAEARAELLAGDQILAARQSRYRERDVSPLYAETFRLESEELYGLREELAAALAKRAREAP